MKKILMVLVALFLSISLVACGDKTPTEDPVDTKKTVIKYCGWNTGTAEDNNLIRRLIDQYNKESDTYKVQIVTYSGSYDEFLTQMAAANNMPDVFMVNSVPAAVMNGWALDLTSLTSADAEWEDVDSALKESITYGGKVYGIPSGQNYSGYRINYDLVNNYLTSGQSAEDIFKAGEYTMEDLYSAVKLMKDTNHDDGSGVVGLDAAGDMLNWVPSILDDSGATKHFVWDGSKLNLAGELMVNSLNKVNEIAAKELGYTFESYAVDNGLEGDDLVEIRKTIFGTADKDAAFKDGRLGFLSQGDWATAKDYEFNYEFIGFPNGKVVVSADFLCINASTKSQAGAFDFAKYMSYGLKGYQARFNIIDSNPTATNLSLSGVPITSNSEVANKWFTYVNMEGLQNVYNKVNSGEIVALVEGNKTVPGYQEARFNYQTTIAIPGVRGGAALKIGDFIWDTCNGDISIDVYKTQMTTALENALNQKIKDAYAAMGITQ